jgi:hypothetical protein
MIQPRRSHDGEQQSGHERRRPEHAQVFLLVRAARMTLVQPTPIIR